MADVPMPRLSDTMEDGTVLRWLKRDGEHVRRGEELVEIETDKASMVYESDLEGTLEIVAREGDTLAVGQPIARIGAAGADGQPDGPLPGGEPVEAAATAAAGQPAPQQTGAPQAPAQAQAQVPAQAPPAQPGDGARVKASPLARRIAREGGVDLQAIGGSGPGGRIVKADVEAAAAARARAPQEPPAPAAAEKPVAAEAAPAMEKPATAKGETTVRELSRTQQTVARRMAESKATIPHFTLESEVDMEACVALRADLKRLAEAPSPTYNDMVVKACALALREHPRANGSYRDGRVQLHSRINVGVAVAVEGAEPAGGALIVPTVFDADTKSLGEIARESRALAERVRSGAITPPELGGATFTVSNLGMFGIVRFGAIINPPQAAILAVGAVRERAVAREGRVEAAHTMTLTLSCDHRILYGADAALFLGRIRELLERPAALSL